MVNREAVKLHSPGSRSAPWVENRGYVFPHPEGVQPLSHPSGVPGCADPITQGALRDPGLWS
jgi:hypothetical protein